MTVRGMSNDEKPDSIATEAIIGQLMRIARMSVLAEMASGISHEINQPLGAIATYAQAGTRLLQRPEPLLDRALEVLQQISTEALLAGEGLRRIRQLFNAGTLDRVPSQMASVLEELRPLCEALAFSARVHFIARLEGPAPDVTIDKWRIQHVVFSLVQNALEACRTSERPARVELGSSVDPYAVEVSVKDSGGGIADESRANIFKPFYTTKPSGTGLGLASCRAIVEAHEGTIGYESDPASGCRFWFRLPIVSRREFP